MIEPFLPFLSMFERPKVQRSMKKWRILKQVIKVFIQVCGPFLLQQLSEHWTLSICLLQVSGEKWGKNHDKVGLWRKQKDLTQNGEIFWWNENRDFEFLGIAGSWKWSDRLPLGIDESYCQKASNPSIFLLKGASYMFMVIWLYTTVDGWNPIPNHLLDGAKTLQIMG